VNYFLNCNKALGIWELVAGIMKVRLRIRVGDWELDCQFLLLFVLWELEVKEVEPA